MMLTAFRWHASNLREPQPEPPREALYAMLAELEAQLRARGERPAGVDCLAWLRPAHMEPKAREAALSLLIVRTTPGQFGTPLRTWFQWQHPQWRWASEPFPDLPELTPA